MAGIKGDEVMGLISIIFHWVMISSLEGSLIICMILLIKFILKNRQGALWHYCIWLILILRLMIPYLPESSISIFNVFNPAVNNLYPIQSNTSKVSKIQNMQIPHTVLAQQNSKTQNPVHDISYNIVNNSNGTLNSKTEIMLLWLIGVIIFAVYIAFINLKLLSKIRKSKYLNDESINQILEGCKAGMNIKVKIRIMLTDEIHTPSLFGIIAPVLLLPSDIINKVSKDELKHIFLHELSHLRRKDNVISWIVVCLKAIHWFNPIIWYGFYKMHEDSEMACDAKALSYMRSEEQIQYGFTIIHLLKLTSEYHRIPGTSGMITDKSKIKRRIIMISMFNKRSFKRTVFGIAALIVLGCVFLTSAKNGVPDINKTVKPILSDAGSTSKAKAKKNSVTAYTITGENFSGKIITISDPAKIAVGYSLQGLKPDKTTSEIAKKYDAAAAINAGYFNSPEPGNSDISATGFIIKDGNVVFSNPKDIRDENCIVNTACFNDKGVLIVGKHSLAQLKSMRAKDAIESGPAAIVNGNPVIKDGDGGMGVAPRTAVGQKKDGTVIMLVIDGRSKESIGATFKDVQDILLEYGAYNAALLDGGSSTTMYYDGNVINHPCSSDGERVIPSVFMVNKLRKGVTLVASGI